MRAAVLLLVFSIITLSSWFRVEWLNASFVYKDYSIRDGNRTIVYMAKILKSIEGPLLGYRVQTYDTVVCVTSDRPLQGTVMMVNDVSNARDSVALMLTLNVSPNVTRCWPMNTIMASTGSSPNELTENLKLLYNLVQLLNTLSPTAILSIAGAVFKQKLEGLYLNVIVKSGNDTVVLTHYYYERMIEQTNACLGVRPLTQLPLVPGATVMFNISNNRIFKLGVF